MYFFLAEPKPDGTRISTDAAEIRAMFFLASPKPLSHHNLNWLFSPPRKQNKMNKHLQALNIIGFLGMLAAHFFVGSFPLFGHTLEQGPSQFHSLFAPAAYVFKIWWFIFFLLAIFTFRQAGGLFQKGVAAPKYVAVIGWLFLVNCLCQVGWFFAWHNLQFGFSLLFMFGSLRYLSRIYLRLGKSARTEWAVILPFSIYLAWAVVSTFINVDMALLEFGRDGFGLPQGTWATVMIGALTLIGLAMLFRKGDTWFSLVLIWALVGIYIKRSGEAPVAETVATAAMIGMAVLLLASVSIGLLKFRR